MPHYADGTEAQVGDFVVGKGYNVKDYSTGELMTIAGTVIHITPDTTACNVQVAYVRVYDVTTTTAPYADNVRILPNGKIAQFGVEYGQADHFTKVV